MGYEHGEDAVDVGEQAMVNTHTHTHSVPRDTQGGWRIVQGLDAILGGAGNGKHTHTHGVPVIHRVVERPAIIRSNLDTCRHGPLTD